MITKFLSIYFLYCAKLKPMRILLIFTITAAALAAGYSITPNPKTPPPPPQTLPPFLVVVDFSKSGLPCLCCDTTTIMRVVRRAYEPFPNIRITTNDLEPLRDYGYKQTVHVTSQTTSAQEAGYAYIGSMWYWPWSPQPAYVYSGKLSISRISAVIVHEIGHTLGLRHQASWSADCKLITATVKGAWMGLADSTGRWMSGKTNEGCNVLQNDSLFLALQLRWR